MTVPSVEPKSERIVQEFFEALLAIKSDSGGNYFVRPADVRKQPISFEECKVYPTYFAVDGDRSFEGKPGGDLKVTFPIFVWVYSKSDDVTKHRGRIIRDLVVALHGDRSRGGLAYDSRITRVRHDEGILAPLTWIIAEFSVSYRSALSEV